MSDVETEVVESAETPASADRWTDLKMVVENLDRDATKNLTKGNVAAGVRLRHGLRKLRAECASLIKDTTARDKERSAGRKDAKAAPAA